jgi:peptidoglycan/LPS O-acetylase OafA/YrhL
MTPGSTRALSGRIPALDSMRAIAATAIVLAHVTFATGLIGQSFWGGWFSRLEGFVNFFFVLSGFVLFRPFAAARAAGTARPSIKVHLIRRIMRIAPPYWALMVVSFLFVVDEIPDVVTWVKHLTFTQFYPSGPLLAGIGPAWTLTVEMAFYVALPFVAMAVLGRRWRPRLTVALLGIGGLGISIGWLSQIRPGRLSVYIHPIWFPSYAACFAAGMVLATVVVALRTGTAPRRWAVLDQIGSAPWACWAVALGLLGICTTPAAGPLGGIGLPTTGELVIRQMLFLAVSVCLLLPIVFGPETSLDRMLSHPTLRWVGTVSLGLFLWHVVVIDAIDAIQGPPLWGGETLFIFATTMALGLGLAALSYYLIERPSQRLAQRARHRSRPAAPAPHQNADREPDARHREDAEDLRPDLAVRMVDGQREPPTHKKEAGWQQQFDHA